ncbi:pirin family protein [Marinimicrobium alkaliphilum]|uniref:pirin family protein n=1 Tax=Marinimicrobium alkaliphilum TaxID=2202654 RepID=UPI000DBAC41D|nr:pirin family protein [Marinimicrobium alkaliphilum]
MQRELQHIVPGMATSDGAGVKIKRSLGQAPYARLDPFLMLDEFNSENANDYIAGFPAHPHRGFETVTYMLDGHMLHEDHMGNRGDLKTGGVQWMTAGRGIIHSEMPQQSEGRMRGFQLWLNLPAAEKMKPANYRDIDPSEIPVATLPGGGKAKVIAGSVTVDGNSITGPISGLSTDPQYWDVHLSADGVFEQPLPDSHNVFVYVYEGDIAIGERKLTHGNAGMLGKGDSIRVTAGKDGARLLVLAGIPIGEPIAQYGPFVMNTQEEIEQAINDYRAGRLAG